jgi:hypothetical protein
LFTVAPKFKTINLPGPLEPREREQSVQLNFQEEKIIIVIIFKKKTFCLPVKSSPSKVPNNAPSKKIVKARQ